MAQDEARGMKYGVGSIDDESGIGLTRKQGNYQRPLNVCQKDQEPT